MKIRKSRMEDVNDIMKIIAAAKQYMVSHGNTTQWVDGYPGEDIIISDIKDNNSYVITHNNSDYLQKARKYGHFTGYKN